MRDANSGIVWSIGHGVVAIVVAVSAGIGPFPLAGQTESVRVTTPTIERLPENPIITPDMLPGEDGENIAGPSLIRAPDWLPDRLGRYYLYFAHHEGRYIRLAYADELGGPWTVHEPGTLRVEETRCGERELPDPSQVNYVHVASPDVHVDHDARRIRMYFHCNVYLGGEAMDPDLPFGADDRRRYPQRTLGAVSEDGVRFEASPEVLGRPYFRVFEWRGSTYALGMPGVFYRTDAAAGLSDFEEGPTLFTSDMRHSAVAVRGMERGEGSERLYVFYTVVGEEPERILLSVIELTDEDGDPIDWMDWRATDPTVVLEPETEWEGGNLPGEPSTRGSILRPVRQLRDPALYQEGGRTYLLYSVAGEQGIAIARLRWED